MMEFLLQYYNQFIQLMKDNPVVAGAFSLWGLTAISFICIKLPGHIYELFKKYFVITLTIRTCPPDDSDYKNRGFYVEQFLKFNKWLNKQFIIYSRTKQLDKRKNDYSTETTFGVGSHLIYFNRSIYYIKFTEQESNASNIAKYIVYVSCLGISLNKFNRLIDEIKIISDTNTKLIVNYNSKEYWSGTYNIRLRSKNSIILNDKLKETIFNSLEFFYNNSNFYIDRGLNYKKVILLHGPPGTGKSSIIKAIASEFNKQINMIFLNDCESTSFKELVLSCEAQKGIIVIEDIDTLRVVYDRDIKDDKQFHKELTLQDILNVLDGIVTPDGAIFILTANSLDKIDKAILRKGRIDEVYFLDLLNDKEIKEYGRMLFLDIEYPENIKYKPTAGCDLQSIFLECNNDKEKYLKELNKLKV